MLIEISLHMHTYAMCHMTNTDWNSNIFSIFFTYPYLDIHRDYDYVYIKMNRKSCIYRLPAYMHIYAKNRFPAVLVHDYCIIANRYDVVGFIMSLGLHSFGLTTLSSSRHSAIVNAGLTRLYTSY